MSSREANIEQLNDAIMTLNDDAMDVHGLIAKSADELENATAAGNRAANNAEKIIEALGPLTELLAMQHRDSTAMLEEAKWAADEQRTETSEQIDALRTTVNETMETLITQTEASSTDLKSTIESSFDALGKAQDDSFADMQAKTLKEHERTRDELQTDILGFKNATSARLDAIEAQMTKTESAIKDLNTRTTAAYEALAKRIAIPIYVAIALGVINLICLVMLLTR
jgi:hypothetical protein